MVCQVLIKSFVFEKALMQEHFNENYMESDEFPKAVFKGKFNDWHDIDLSKDSEYKMTVSGTLSLHGKIQDVSPECNLVVKDGKLSINTVFMVHPEDFGIEIPAGKKDNISNNIEITFNAAYKPL